MKKIRKKLHIFVMTLALASMIAGPALAVRAESGDEAAGDAQVSVSAPAEQDPAPAPDPEETPVPEENYETVPQSETAAPASEVPSPEAEVTPSPESAADSTTTDSLTDSLPESGPDSEAESIPEGREAYILFTGNIHGNASHFGQLAAYRAQLMEEGAEILVVDAGNAFSGNNAIISLMNAVPVDLALPGADEFAGGNALLKELAGAASFRYISANYTDLASGSLVYAPYATGQLGDRRVSFVGLSLPASLPEEEAAAYGFREDALAAAAQSAVTAARNEGAGAVILLISMTDAQMETARQIVSQLSGVNAAVISVSEASVSRRWTDASGTELQVCSAGNDLARIGCFTLEEDGTLTASLIESNSVQTDGSETVRSAYSYAQGLVYEYQSQFEADTFGAGDDGNGSAPETDGAAGSAAESEEEDVDAAAAFSENARERAANTGDPLNTETDPQDVLPEENAASAAAEKEEASDSTAEDLSGAESVESMAEDLIGTENNGNLTESSTAQTGTDSDTDESDAPEDPDPTETPTPTPTPTNTPTPTPVLLNTDSADNATETANSLNTASVPTGLDTTSGNTLNTASVADTTSSGTLGTDGAVSTTGAGTGDGHPIAFYVVLLLVTGTLVKFLRTSALFSRR